MGKQDQRFAEACTPELAEECEMLILRGYRESDDAALAAGLTKVVNAFMGGYYFPEHTRLDSGVKTDSEYFLVETTVLTPLDKAWRHRFPLCHDACRSWLRKKLAEPVMASLGVPAIDTIMAESMRDLTAGMSDPFSASLARRAGGLASKARHDATLLRQMEILYEVGREPDLSVHLAEPEQD